MKYCFCLFIHLPFIFHPSRCGASIFFDNYEADMVKIEQELANVHLGIGAPNYVSYRGAPSIERRLHIGVKMSNIYIDMCNYMHLTNR